MPPGDAQRVWFPEMLDELERFWSSSVTWEELAEFCRRMTELRADIRESRGILPPRRRCPCCGSVSRGDIRGASIRSALFALKKLGALTDEDFKVLDRSWKAHRMAHRLDAYGRSTETVAAIALLSGECC